MFLTKKKRVTMKLLHHHTLVFIFTYLFYNAFFEHKMRACEGDDNAYRDKHARAHRALEQQNDR